jgi:hypothetical protein
MLTCDYDEERGRRHIDECERGGTCHGPTTRGTETNAKLASRLLPQIRSCFFFLYFALYSLFFLLQRVGLAEGKGPTTLSWDGARGYKYSVAFPWTTSGILSCVMSIDFGST